MTSKTPEGLSNLEYHVLLALAEGAQYGYAIRDAVELDSAGALTPRAGSLYRVLARLMTWGFVAETAGRVSDGPHPGLARRYYVLTTRGHRTLADETRRLKAAAALAERRLRWGGSRS